MRHNSALTPSAKANSLLVDKYFPQYLPSCSQEPAAWPYPQSHKSNPIPELLKDFRRETSGTGSSVGIATDYALDGTWSRFSARPDRPWGPPSLLYNGYRVFPGGRGRDPRKSRAIPLLTLRAFVAYKKGENLPTRRESKSWVTHLCRFISLHTINVESCHLKPFQPSFNYFPFSQTIPRRSVLVLSSHLIRRSRAISKKLLPPKFPFTSFSCSCLSPQMQPSAFREIWVSYSSPAEESSILGRCIVSLSKHKQFATVGAVLDPWRSVERLAMGRTIPGSNSGGCMIFRTRPDRSCGPKWIPGHFRKYRGRGEAFTTHPHPKPRLKKE